MARHRQAHPVIARGCAVLGLVLVATSVWAFLTQAVLVAAPVAVVAAAVTWLAVLLLRSRWVLSGGSGPDSPGSAGAMEPRRPRRSPPALSAEADPDLAKSALA